jgi:single-strand DNA-binding protein
MKNIVTLVGFVGNAPEVRTTRNNNAITSLSLATNRSYKNEAGERQDETEWHRITCFSGIGRHVAERVAKGAMIMVTGRIHYTRYTDKTGSDRFGCEIIAERVDFLSKAKAAADARQAELFH